MGRNYKQLSLEERCAISRFHENGKSIRQIATIMDRSASTISRELKRNLGSAATSYSPAYAYDMAWERRWRGSRLERHPALRNHVLDRLVMGWSPEQIAGRMRSENNSMTISHESIYRFIYAQIARKKDYSWRHYLPRAKSKRGFRGRKGGSSVDNIKERISIDERPKHILDRNRYGHWEADLMMTSDKKHNLLVLHERKSRMTMLQWNHNKNANNIANSIIQKMSSLPSKLRQSMTFDNGTEFAHHTKIIEKLQMSTYFCHPRKPWQKGGVENMNGRIRRYIPRNINVNSIKQDDILMLQNIINSTPRKCLGFKTPSEVFCILLHFKCESTFLLSQE